MALPTLENPLRLTLAEIKANALLALQEGRLQACQSRTPVGGTYGTPSRCCVIGASLPPDVAKAADEGAFGGYSLDKLASTGLFIVDKLDAASALQDLHDILLKRRWLSAEERTALLLEALS